MLTIDFCREREFNKGMGDAFKNEFGQINDPTKAEDIARLEKPARDFELSLERLSEGGLTSEEEKHAKVLHTLLEKYPNAFDRQNDGQGRIILKSREPARNGAVYLYVTERGCVEIHRDWRINLCFNPDKHYPNDGLQNKNIKYLKDGFVEDVDKVVSGELKGRDAGNWVTFPRPDLADLALLQMRKADLLNSMDIDVWKPVLQMANERFGSEQREKQAEPSLADKLASL